MRCNTGPAQGLRPGLLSDVPSGLNTSASGRPLPGRFRVPGGSQVGLAELVEIRNLIARQAVGSGLGDDPAIVPTPVVLAQFDDPASRRVRFRKPRDLNDFPGRSPFDQPTLAVEYVSGHRHPRFANRSSRARCRGVSPPGVEPGPRPSQGRMHPPHSKDAVLGRDRAGRVRVRASESDRW